MHINALMVFHAQDMSLTLQQQRSSIRMRPYNVSPWIQPWGCYLSNVLYYVVKHI
jgi:hypothetical protein